MDRQRRKELVKQFQEIKVYMGMFQIKNLTNGKIYIDAVPNLKDQWNSIKEFQLKMNTFPNSELQNDWNTLGEDAFVYEELEAKEVKEDSQPRVEIKRMKKEWLELLEPYGEKGYHRKR